jgi:hypothetical protein
MMAELVSDGESLANYRFVSVDLNDIADEATAKACEPAAEPDLKSKSPSNNLDVNGRTGKTVLRGDVARLRTSMGWVRASGLLNSHYLSRQLVIDANDDGAVTAFIAISRLCEVRRLEPFVLALLVGTPKQRHRHTSLVNAHST